MNKIKNKLFNNKYNNSYVIILISLIWVYTARKNKWKTVLNLIEEYWQIQVKSKKESTENNFVGKRRRQPILVEKLLN